jgi:hypothetical protein
LSDPVIGPAQGHGELSILRKTGHERDQTPYSGWVRSKYRGSSTAWSP